MEKKIKLTPAEQGMRWERMSGERLSDDHRRRLLDGDEFHPPQLTETLLRTTAVPCCACAAPGEVYEQTYGSTKGYLIVCSNDDCMLFVQGDDPDQAILDWNDGKAVEHDD
jgi:hypothetical protein